MLMDNFNRKIKTHIGEEGDFELQNEETIAELKALH